MKINQIEVNIESLNNQNEIRTQGPWADSLILYETPCVFFTLFHCIRI